MAFVKAALSYGRQASLHATGPTAFCACVSCDWKTYSYANLDWTIGTMTHYLNGIDWMIDTMTRWLNGH